MSHIFSNVHNEKFPSEHGSEMFEIYSVEQCLVCNKMCQILFVGWWKVCIPRSCVIEVVGI